MVYSKSLAARIRQALGDRRELIEKRMFGGVAFLLSGNMLVGVWESSLIARLGADQAANALQQDFVREFDVTGRPMKGWVMVEPDGLETDVQLDVWLEQALAFVKTLPPK